MGDKRQNDGLQPGPCPIVNGEPQCPPPTEINVIKAKRVYEECVHTQTKEIDIEVAIVPAHEQLTAECGDVTVLTLHCQKLDGNVVKVTAELEVTTIVNETTGTGTMQIEKLFIMERAGEPELSPQCHIYPECLLCFVSDEGENFVTVTCCVGVLLLLKLEADVQLMIPSYGYPPEPAECDEAVGQCPAEYQPTWPPYPSQNNE